MIVLGFVLFALGGMTLAVVVMSLAVVLGKQRLAIEDLNRRIDAIEKADAEAEQAVDVWFTRSPATVTAQGLES